MPRPRTLVIFTLLLGALAVPHIVLGAAPKATPKTVPSDVPLESVIADLSSTDSKVVARAIYALESRGSDSAPAVAKLREFFTKPDLADNALRALAAIGPAAKDAVPDITQLLQTSNLPAVQLCAHYALYRIGHSSDEHLKAIIDVTKSPESDIRRHAYEIVRRIGPAAADAAPALAKDLVNNSVSFSVVCDTIRALGANAKVDPTFEPTLQKMVEAAPSNRSIARVYVSISPDPAKAIAVFNSFVIDKMLDYDSRSNAAVLLGQMGDPALPTLKKLLTSSDPDACIHAISGLAHMGTPAGPTLVNLLSNPKLGSEAYKALKTLRDPPILLLIQALKSKNHAVVQYSAQVLGEVTPPPPAALYPLLFTVDEARKLEDQLRLRRSELLRKDELLEDALRQRQRHCCIAISKYGPEGEAAAFWSAKLMNNLKYRVKTVGAASTPNMNGMVTSRVAITDASVSIPSLLQFMTAYSKPNDQYGILLLSPGRFVANELISTAAKEFPDLAKMEKLTENPAQAPEARSGDQWYRLGWLYVIVNPDGRLHGVLSDNIALRKWITDSQAAAKILR